MTIALATSLPGAAVAQGAGVAVGGFETDGSVGLSRDEYDALARALGAILSAEVGERTVARLVPITSGPARPGRVDVGGARSAAAKAGAKVLVIGSLLDQYGDIHLEARMIDAATGEPIAVVRGDPALGRREQLTDAVADLADRIGKQPAIGGGRSGARRTVVPVEALVQFGRGLRFEEAGDRPRAQEAYRAALKTAPGLTEATTALRRVGG